MSEPFIRSLVVDRDAIDDPSAYPFSIPAIAGLTELELDPHVTFLAGPNAAGKSTLIEAIAVAAGLNPEGGGRNFTFETRASHSALGEIVRLVRGVRRPRTDFFLRAESFFTLASEIEGLGDTYGGRSLHEQSHGQSFLSMLVERFGPMACTSSTSPSPRSRRRASSRCCAASTSSWPRAASS